MKLFPAKCHERATLRKLWRQTGNSSLLPAKCWPLLHVIAGISAWFSNFSFVLFCYKTNHLMTGPLGNSEFCFSRISMCPSTSSRETLTFSGNKIHCSPRDQSLSVNHYMATMVRALWLAAERALFSCNDRALWNFLSARRLFWVVTKTTCAWAKTTEKMDKVQLYFQ